MTRDTAWRLTPPAASSPWPAIPPPRNFPTTPNALAQTPASGFTSNGFVTQFQSTQPGSPTSTYNMLYSTYLGGSYRDDTYGMTMDPTGLIVVTGRTE